MATLRVRILGDAKQAVRELKSVEVAAGQLQHRIEAGVGLGLGAAFTGLGVGLGIVAKNALSSAEQLQDAQASFTTLLGSAAQAQRLVAQVQGFAVRTPFNTADTLDATKLLLNTGTTAKQVIPILTAFGNVVAATGGKTDQLNGALLAYSQVVGKGKADTIDLYQLINNGIPIVQLLGKELHKTGGEVLKLASQGKISANDVLGALTADPKYAAGLQRANKTLSGELAGLGDTFQQGLGKALAPVLPLLASQVDRITNLLGDLFPVFDKEINHLLPGLERNLPKAVDKTLKALAGIPNDIKHVVQFVRSLPSTFATTIQALGPFGEALKELFSGTGEQGRTSFLQGLNQLLTGGIKLLTQALNLLGVVKRSIDGVFGSGTTGNVAGKFIAFYALNKLLLGIPGLAIKAAIALARLALVGKDAKAASTAATAARTGGLLGLGKAGLGRLFGDTALTAGGSTLATGGAATAGSLAGIVGSAIAGGYLGKKAFENNTLGYGNFINFLTGNNGRVTVADKLKYNTPLYLNRPGSGVSNVSITNNYRNQLTPREQRKQIIDARMYAGAH